jgi:integrase
VVAARGMAHDDRSVMSSEKGTRRRGWRQPVETGIWKSHRAGCPTSVDHKTGRRCSCPFTVSVPRGSRGASLATVAGSLEDARRVRGRGVADAGTVRATPARGAETLHEHATAWFETRAARLRPDTWLTYDRAYRKRVAPKLGAVPLEQLTRERCERWIVSLARDPKRRAAEHALETLSTMLTAAVEWGKLPANPLAGLRLPKAPPKPRKAAQVITPEQVEGLLEHAGSLRNRTMLRAICEGGLRVGEVIGLRWPQVDLDAGRLTIAETIHQQQGGARVTLTPKGGRTHRAAITPELAAELAAWRTESIVAGNDADGYVWPGQGGRPLARSSLRGVWHRAFKRAGLQRTTMRDDGTPKAVSVISPHGGRHTAASVALDRGVPVTVVSAQLGHADTVITGRTYAHMLSDERLDGFAQAQRADAGLRAGLRGTVEEPQTLS